MKPEKNLIYISIMAFTLFSFTLFFSQSGTSAQMANINGSIVNMRSGPGIAHNITGTLCKDTRVEAMESLGEWTRVKYGTSSGWIKTELLHMLEPIGYLTVQEELVNLRSGPGTSFDILGQARKGDELLLVESSLPWYQAQLKNGQIVYVAASLVSVKVAPEVPPEASQPPPSSNSTPNPAAAPRVFLDGQELIFDDAAPIIIEGRTLVPLRAIFEAMGAEVNWHAAMQTVYARKGDVLLVLPVNSSQATLNGKVLLLNIPAQLVNNRTLVPLRFIGEAFGDEVSWDNNTRTVTISTPQPASPNKVPSRVRVAETEVNLRSGPGTFYELLDVARAGDLLEVVGEKDGWYQISRGGQRVWIATRLVNEAAEDVNPDSPGNDKVHLSSSRDDKGISIIMQSGETLQADIAENPGKIVYQFKGRQLEGLNHLKETLGVDYLEARGSNEMEHAQVTISLPPHIEYQTISEDGGKKQVLFIPNFILSIETKPYGTFGEKIIVTTMCPVKYTEKLEGNKLQLNFGHLAINQVKNIYRFNSDLLNSIEIEASPPDNAITTMNIYTRNLGKHAYGLSQGNRALNIILLHQRDNIPDSKLVYLDVGHGGKDSGACGAQINEKDINLDVALRTGKILEQKGLQVAYSRTDDTFIEVEEESAIANALCAGVFVAIHCNSSTSSTGAGTETYFWAPLEQPELFVQRDERCRLASILQTQLVNRLQRADRGVKEKDLSVLRNTNMVSAFVELAFISNPIEHDLLQQNEFKNKAAQAIADGIIEYFN